MGSHDKLALDQRSIMKLIISAQTANLESPVDNRFGRCSWFIKYDTDTNQWEAFQNPGVNQSGGAGVAAAQFVIDQKAEVVISGDFGPNAANAFRAARIEMRVFGSEVNTVQQAIERYTKNELSLF